VTEVAVAADAAIGVAHEGNVLTLTLNRPSKGNALRQEDCALLLHHIKSAEEHDDVRAVLIRSEGKHFCAGADLVSANASQSKPRIGHLTRGLERGAHGLISVLGGLSLPTISAVQGKAIGLGLHLAAVCDFVVAAEDASFAELFCKRGFSVDSGGSFILPSLIGIRRARQMLLRGVPVDAPTAVDWGLIDDVVPPDVLDSTTSALAAELATGPTFSLGHTKRLLRNSPLAGLDAALADEAHAVEATIRSADFKEGIRAFTERREPAFTGN
jgi:2-(1,2-epoxy-1,2-dihydrophenyl)acetyl-CoA isomerase